MNWKSLSKLVLCIKVCKKAKFAKFYKFYSLLTLFWKGKSSLERKILGFTHNPHTSHKFAQTLALTLSLDLQSSIVQMKLEGSKMGVYIYSIGEGKLKGHQINGWLPLGNITWHLSLPQLIPHFGNLHWWMDNFGLPYRIELRCGA